MAENDQAAQSRFRRCLLLGFAGVFAVQALASLKPGITWDEPFYVFSGQQYVSWLVNFSGERSLTREEIDRNWAVNHEHPPAAKMVYGLSQFFAPPDTISFYTPRLLAAVLFTGLAVLVYLMTALHFGRPAGVFAALAFVLMPRVFGHGHVAALDVPVALAIFAATFAFSDAHTGLGRSVLAGFLFGLALLTKFNAVLVPVVLIPWALWCFRKRAILPCLLLLVIGGGVFLGGWPWLWHDTWPRLKEYTVNKIERVGDGQRPTGTTAVPVHYLGRTYVEPPAPWHYPFVLTLVTVPVALLVFAGIGIPLSLGKGKPRPGVREPAVSRRSVGALLLASALLPLVAGAVPGAPKYDGVRLFMPAFPFLACLAGIGAAWAWRRRPGKVIVVVLLALESAALVYTHPYELSYYNAAVGGAWGAKKLGFETTYWGDTVNADVLVYVNEHCPDGSTIDVQPPCFRDIGIIPGLKDTLRYLASPGGRTPDFRLMFPREGYLDASSQALLRTGKPIRQWTYLGVPQCLLYDLRPDRSRP